MSRGFAVDPLAGFRENNMLLEATGLVAIVSVWVVLWWDKPQADTPLIIQRLLDGRRYDPTEGANDVGSVGNAKHVNRTRYALNGDDKVYVRRSCRFSSSPQRLCHTGINLHVDSFLASGGGKNWPFL